MLIYPPGFVSSLALVFPFTRILSRVKTAVGSIVPVSPPFQASLATLVSKHATAALSSPPPAARKEGTPCCIFFRKIIFYTFLIICRDAVELRAGHQNRDLCNALPDYYRTSHFTTSAHFESRNWSEAMSTAASFAAM